MLTWLDSTEAVMAEPRYMISPSRMLEALILWIDVILMSIRGVEGMTGWKSAAVDLNFG